MGRIFDNTTAHFLPALKQAMAGAYRADICSGYFNLAGWGLISRPVTSWRAGQVCRILVGMGDGGQVPPTRQGMAALVAEKLMADPMSGEGRNLLKGFQAELRAGKVAVRFEPSGAEHSKVYLFYPSSAPIPTDGWIADKFLVGAGH